MAKQSNLPSRRTVLTAGSTLLGGFGLGLLRPGTSDATELKTAQPTTQELAAYRPIAVSSTDYAPTPGAFAVDKITEPGVRGTGWRAADGDPQWIAVDLQADCQVASVRLTFEAKEGDPVFTPPASGNPYDGTTGKEILSSYAVTFVVETSRRQPVVDDRVQSHRRARAASSTSTWTSRSSPGGCG